MYFTHSSIFCGLGRTRTFNLWIKDYISDSNRNYNFHYIKKWPLCVVCHFLIDGLQLSVHCSAIELQTHIVVSINYTSVIRNSLEIMKLFSSSLFIYLSFPYIILKNHKKFNFLEYFSKITKGNVELARNFQSVTSPFSIYYTTRNEFRILLN